MKDGERYDAIVVGMGGMGSAASAHLAERDLDVLGLERFGIPHSRGSSHGYSRIISRSFYERPAYMSLYERALDSWRELERVWGERRILHQSGSITAGKPGTDVLERAMSTCERFDLPYERLDATDASRRFPGYDLPADHEVVFQPDDGFLVPRYGVLAHVALAHRRGAEIHAHLAVEDWRPTADGVAVTTDAGTVHADVLVIAAGPWTPALLDVVRPIATPERQVLARFQPADPRRFEPESFPVSAITAADGQYSAFPIHGVPGVKVARVHHLHERVDPDEMTQTVTDRDEAVLRRFADAFLDGGSGPTMRLETCLYTNTPDERFVLDTHPDHPQVAFATGFSGHGYKFCPVVGEILADLVVDGETEHDLAPFRLDRF